MAEEERQKECNPTPTWFAVFCCGCTDCFPHAAFVVREQAVEWARSNCRNPEGYIIKQMTAQEFAELIDEDSY
jgi:hypothetical protein